MHSRIRTRRGPGRHRRGARGCRAGSGCAARTRLAFTHSATTTPTHAASEEAQVEPQLRMRDRNTACAPAASCTHVAGPLELRRLQSHPAHHTTTAAGQQHTFESVGYYTHTRSTTHVAVVAPALAEAGPTTARPALRAAAERTHIHTGTDTDRRRDTRHCATQCTWVGIKHDNRAPHMDTNSALTRPRERRNHQSRGK